MYSRSVSRVAVAVILLAPALALANGRPPATRDVHFRPGDAQFIANPATFGLMLSQDDGATWYWVCEEAIGYSGQYDPDYSVAADGRIFATTFFGLRVSQDGGCTWNTVAGPWGDAFIADVEIGSDGRVWAIASALEDNGVYYSDNDGDTWTRSGLEHAGAYWGTIRIAPSSTQRLYVSGFEVPEGGGDPIARIYRSNNGGTSWTELPTTDFTFGVQVRVNLSAVSPTNPDVVLGVVPASVGTDFIGDALYRTTDGGQTWTQVVAFSGEIRGVLFRGNGTDVIAGTPDDGVRYSADGGATWPTMTEAPQMACLGERDDGTLFACGGNAAPDNFALGRSTNGMDWTKVYAFAEIDGPLSCPADTDQKMVCEDMRWCSMAATLGVSDPRCGGDGGGVAVDASVAPDAGGGGGDGGCGGCNAALAGVIVVLPWRRRRRRCAR